jgi:hypothetical protein
LKKNESLSIFISPKLDRARQTILKNEPANAVPLVVAEDDGSESSTATEKETSEIETESDMEVKKGPVSLAFELLLKLTTLNFFAFCYVVIIIV